MQIKLKNTSQQIELVKAMASKNVETAMKARDAFAAFIGPIIQQVINLLGTSNLIYVDWPYDEDDMPSIPLDRFYGAPVNNVQVWQQSEAGGLGSSLTSGLTEMLVSTFKLDTAISLRGKEVRRGRLPAISLALNRASQELLRKIERNGWFIVLKALAEASTNGTKHTITSTTQDVLQVDDFNRLINLVDDINVAFDGGTPDSQYTTGPTDMFLSPRMLREIRSWSYQPMNTRAVPDTSESTSTPLPDSIREQIFRAGGNPEIFNITLHKQLELGTGKRYTNIFAGLATAGIAAGGGNFNAASDEVVIGADLTKGAAISPIAQNAEYGTTLVMEPDTQFSNRSDKIAFAGGVEKGFAVVDSREFCALVV